MNDYKLNGKTAIVTGAGQGIGKAAAKAVAYSGANVVLCGRTLEKLEKTAEEIRELGAETLTVKMDVTNIDDIERSVRDAVDRFGHIDILLNCAGVWKPSKLVELEPNFWDSIMDINLKGALELAEYDINVVAVAPGFTYSEMLQDVFRKRGASFGKDPKVFEQEVNEQVPMKRMARTDEVGSLMAYLASEDASYITGVVITIAGGNITV